MDLHSIGVLLNFPFLTYGHIWKLEKYINVRAYQLQHLANISIQIQIAGWRDKPHNRLHSDSRRLSKSIRATPVETRPSLSYVQPVVIVPKKLTFLDSLAEWFEIITAIRVPSMKSPDTFLQSRFLKIIQASEKRTHVMPVLFGNQPVFPSLRQNVKIHQIDCKASSYSDLAFASLLVCVLVSHHIFVLASIPRASHAFTYILVMELFCGYIGG